MGGRAASSGNAALITAFCSKNCDAMHVTGVKVYVGNRQHVYACIRYETEDSDVEWLVAMVILLCVLLLLLIVLIILCLCKLCGGEKRRKTAKDEEMEFTSITYKPSDRRPDVSAGPFEG